MISAGKYHDERGADEAVTSLFMLRSFILILLHF
jgi:hypothetical protein